MSSNENDHEKGTDNGDTETGEETDELPRLTPARGKSSKDERERRGLDPYDTSRKLEGEDAIEVFRRRRSFDEKNLPPEREKRRKLEIEPERPPDDPKRLGFDPYDTSAKGPPRRRR